MYRDIVRNHAGVFAALILGVATLVVVFVISRDVPVREAVATPALASPATDAISKKIAQKDSDGDGLYDWEEQLWGTDPFKVDTNGDGVLDGDEVRARIQQNKDSGTPVIPQQDASPKTSTAKFSQDFFKRYIELRADGELTPAEAQQVLTRGLSDVSFTLPQPPKTTLTVVAGADSAILSNYFNTLGNIIVKNTPSDLGVGEARLLQEALQNKEEKPLVAVGHIADGYTNFTKDFATMTVPETLLPAHMEILEASNELASIIRAFSNAFTDPINALAAIPAYKTSSQKLLKGFQRLTETAQEINYVPDASSVGYEVYRTGL